MVAPVQVKWCTVPLSEVQEHDLRLEASVYDIEVHKARQRVVSNPHGFVRLQGENNSPVSNAFYGNRGKRNYIPKGFPNAIGFLGSSEMLACSPEPEKFMLDSLSGEFRIRPGMILVSRSGTIGNLTFANKTLSRFLVSEHAIRLECRDFPGFLYTFLKSHVGQLLIKGCVFGSVIQEIEPEHLASIPVPNAPEELKRRIHDLIIHSYALRDESNALLARAQTLLAQALSLRPIIAFPEYRNPTEYIPQTYSVHLKDLAGRFDCSFHLPLARAIEKHLLAHATNVKPIGHPHISKRIILPTRFARVYVDSGHGRVMIGGKQLGELDPSNKKYLSATQHKQELDRLAISPGTLLVSRSGTIGKVALAMPHWNQWIPSDHIIRIIPASNAIAGFLYVWLSSEWARPLIVRHSFGAVIDEISDIQLASVPVPLLSDSAIQAEINELALTASSKRSEAYDLEQSALRTMETEVLY